MIENVQARKQGSVRGAIISFESARTKHSRIQQNAYEGPKIRALADYFDRVDAVRLRSGVRGVFPGVISAV